MDQGTGNGSHGGQAASGSPAAATLTLEHQVGRTTFVVYHHTRLPVVLDPDRRETRFAVQCSHCHEIVTARVPGRELNRRRLRLLLGGGLAILALDALAAVFTMVTLDSDTPYAVLGAVFLGVTLPFGIVRTLVGALAVRQATIVPRRTRYPHKFHVDIP